MMTMNNAERGEQDTRVVCPYCGYKMPVFYDNQAESRRIYMICKGRNCKRRFEVTIKQGQQVR